MSIQRLQAHWGFTRMPFGRSLAPSMLHRHDGHAEAVARIGWCFDQQALGAALEAFWAGATSASQTTHCIKTGRKPATSSSRTWKWAATRRGWGRAS